VSGLDPFGRKISIIGGTGRMGRWFAKFFKDKGFQVLIAGRSLSKARRVAAQLGVEFAEKGKPAVEDADMVMVATTLNSTAAVLLENAPLMKRGAVLMDVASLKSDVIPALQKAEAYGVHCLSLHPMFGPAAQTMAGKNMLVIPVSSLKGELRRLLRIFSEAGARVVILPNAQVHDRMMALTLALPHFVNIVFGRTLSAAGEKIGELQKFAGTTFSMQTLLAGSVLQEDPQTYGSIQIDNKAFLKILSLHIEKVNELKRIIQGKDKASFIKFFDAARDYLAESAEFKASPKKVYSALEFLKSSG